MRRVADMPSAEDLEEAEADAVAAQQVEAEDAARVARAAERARAAADLADDDSDDSDDSDSTQAGAGPAVVASPDGGKQRTLNGWLRRAGKAVKKPSEGTPGPQPGSGAGGSGASGQQPKRNAKKSGECRECCWHALGVGASATHAMRCDPVPSPADPCPRGVLMVVCARRAVGKSRKAILSDEDDLSEGDETSEEIEDEVIVESSSEEEEVEEQESDGDGDSAGSGSEPEEAPKATSRASRGAARGRGARGRGGRGGEDSGGRSAGRGRRGRAA